MKNIIYGVVTLLIGVVVTLTIVTITGTMNREIELEDALQIAVKKSVEACTSRKGYDLDNNNQFVADLLVELSNEIENDADLEVEVMGVDKDKGVLSIRVTEYYTTATGTRKQAKCEATAYMDKGRNENSITGSIITFLDSDGSYLGEQRVEDGKPVKATTTPAKAGYTFDGWLNTTSNQYVGTNLGVANGNATYKATYR